MPESNRREGVGCDAPCRKGPPGERARRTRLFHFPDSSSRSIPAGTGARVDMNRMRIAAVAAILFLAGSPGASASDGANRLAVVGSDTLEVLVRDWADAFARTRPDVSVVIDEDGSADAPPALASGAADLGAMSRPMTRTEARTVEEATGIAPTGFTVALGAIAVIVHRDNPLEGLTLSQLDRIFSAGRACGEGAPITTWRELVVGAPASPIALHGRDARSGTAEAFRAIALCEGRFADRFVEEKDSAAVVEAVASDPAAIGFVGLGYLDERVRPLAVGAGDDVETLRYYPFIVPRFADSPDPTRKYAYVFDGRYPLARALWLYALKPAGEALPEHVEAFVRLALSEDGQETVADEGFVPLTPAMAAEERARLAPDYRERRRLLPWL